MGKKKGVKKGVRKGAGTAARSTPPKERRLGASYLATASLKEAQDLKLRDVDKASEEFLELVASIRQHGFYDPILVTERNGDILVVDGYNRLAAAKEVGLKEVPITHVQGSREDLVLAAFDLSTRRINMTPMTEARAVARAMEALGTKTAKEVAKRMGRSERWVSIHTQLLALPKDLQKGLDGGDTDITVGKCHELLRVHPEDRGRFIGKLRELTEPFFRAHIEHAVKNGTARWADGRKEPRKPREDKKTPREQADKHKRTPQTAVEGARGPEVVVSSEPVLEGRPVAEVQRAIRKVEGSLSKYQEKRAKAETDAGVRGKKKKLKGKQLAEFVAAEVAKWDEKNSGTIIFLRGQVAGLLYSINLDPGAPSLVAALAEWCKANGIGKPKTTKVGGGKKKAARGGKKKAARGGKRPTKKTAGK